MPSADQQQEFAERFSTVESDLFRYVLSAVIRHADALDVLQETATALWEKFDEYDRAQPFGPWARKFAHVQVLKYRLYKKLPSGRNVLLGQSAIDALSAEYEQHHLVLDARKAALKGCIQQLSEDDRQLLDWRYWENVNLREAAADTGTSEDKLYGRLRRIRRELGECIDRTLAKDM